MKSLVPKKKFTVVRFDASGKLPIKKTHFGAEEFDDFTLTKNEEQKRKYISRHRAREDWNDLNTAGAWAKGILWNRPTIDESIKAMERQFGIKIIRI